MVKLLFHIFLFILCIFCKCKFLNAVNTKLEVTNVCSTPQCIFASFIIRQYMDPKVKPCDDFNQFACGTFLRETTIPKDRRRVDRYDIIYRKNQEQLQDILAEKSQPNEPRWITLTKNFNRACMNTAAIEKNGLRSALGDFKELGGWPVLDGNLWQEAKFDWKQSTYKMLKLGYGTIYFFISKVTSDYTNYKKYMLNIDQPSLSIDREDLVKGFNNKNVNAYYNLMVDIAFSFGADRATAARELKESLEFEIKLANISISEADRSNQTVLNNPMNVTQLSQKYPSIPWKEYFNSIYSTLKSRVVIGDNETIIVSVPTFFEKFGKLIKDTPKRVQANYHIWRAAHDDLDYLTEEIRNRQMKFVTVLNSTDLRPERRKECLDDEYKTLLRYGISALYVRKYFSPASKKSAEELAVDIEKRFKRIIQEADWMDEKTRTNALNRLASLKNFIGCPDEYFDDKILNEFYKNLEITPNDYLKASDNISFLLDSFYFNRLGKPVNTSEWTIHSETPIVGPFFSIEGNGIEIPAGILQDLFFNKDALQYMNYAGIGSFNMGHEMTHLFDNLDAYMTPETKKKYLANADCIAKQYGNYTAQEIGLKLNGAFTRTENINDNAGVKVSYLAYQDWVKRNGAEPKLPGLTNYSQSQLFWINAAIQQCDKYTLEFLRQIVTTDIHSPSGFRIIGAFSNRPEFARDFNCPLGSKMNPTKKCSVW